MTTNATNETQYFHFPLFASGDKPSWLTDWNGTVEELDNILEQYRVSIQANSQGMESFNEQITVIRNSITTVNERLSNDEATIEDIQSAINGFNTALIQADTSIKELTAWKNSTTSVINGINNDITSLNTNISNLSNELNTLRNTVNDGFNNLNSEVNNITGDVSTIRQDLDTAEDDIDNLKTTTNNHTTQIQTNTNDITSLRSKVTYLAIDDEQNIDNIATKWGIVSVNYYHVGDIVYMMVDDVDPSRIKYKLFECLKNHPKNTISPTYKPDINGETEYWKPLNNVCTCITELNNEIKTINEQIDTSRSRFLLAHESNNFRSQHFTSDVVTTQFVDMSTNDMSSFLKGGSEQSVSKLIEVSLLLYIADDKTVTSAISKMAQYIFDPQNHLNPFIGLKCYETEYSEIQSSADKTYFAPITGVCIYPEFNDISGGYYVYVTYSIDGPEFTYDDLSQFNSIFAYLPMVIDSITLYHTDGSKIRIDVDSSTLQSMSFRKVGI